MAVQSSRHLGRGQSIPERVAQLYYSHGLFCSSRPAGVLAFTAVIVLLCCYPLLNLPLPGNVPQGFSTPVTNFTVPVNGSWEGGSSQTNTDGLPPRWYRGHPACYIQQVVVKAAVSPWTEDLILTDAFRGPLSEVFKLVEIIRNYQLESNSKTMSHVCMHVESSMVKPSKKLVLPEFNCLILSPANLWQQNKESFQDDANLLSTIIGYQNIQKGKISVAEILFGMTMKDTGIKRYPLRTRQRVLHYAITIALQQYDVEFIEGLQKKLVSMYPLHTHNETLDSKEIFHIYFPAHWNWREFLPLIIAYFILFLYIYFSVRKIELVKSKFGMAFSAVVTVAASLCMSVGLCFFFGLTLSMNGKEIFPYLVVVVGLENVIVITKSVVSTPTHLDVKIRIAQGLSREGWSITKNLLTEVTILTVGFFTFVPAIQEFCIFAVVGLLSDFFLQMLFFTTVLAIDIRRMELAESPRQQEVSGSKNNALFRSPVSGPGSRIVRSKSQPRLYEISPNYPANVVAPLCNTPVLVKLPKRLRLVHFWARTRIFQRAFMVSMVVWIVIIIYNSGIVQRLSYVSEDSDIVNDTSFDNVELKSYISSLNLTESVASGKLDLKALTSIISDSDSSVKPSVQEDVKYDFEDVAKLKHGDYEPWRRISYYHWPTIFGMYNISIAGNYISILPPISLSIAVKPEVAISIRNPNERGTIAQFQWQALAVALDPLDFSDVELKGSTTPSTRNKNLGSEVPFVPSSPMELFLTAVLCIISVVFLAYMMVVFYRCMCTKNYAEWRASWAGEPSGQNEDGSTQVVMETVPLVLDGHSQDVECLVSDGTIIVSSCLGGQIRVWDGSSGELCAKIDRKRYFTSQSASHPDDIDPCEEPLSDYESGSPPSQGELGDGGRMHPFLDAEGGARTLYNRSNNMRYLLRKGSIQLHDTDPGINIPNVMQQRHAFLAGGDASSVAYYKKTDDVMWSMPDLRPVINTNFSSCKLQPVNQNCKRGYDFSQFRTLYDQHKKSFEEDENEFECVDFLSNSGMGVETYPVGLDAQCENELESLRHSPEHAEPHSLQWHGGGCTPEGAKQCCTNNLENSPNSPGGAGFMYRERQKTVPPVWCMDCQDNLLALGCSNGRIEFWEGTTGKFKCMFEDGNNIGITSLKVIGNRVVAAKLSGCVDFFELESYRRGKQMDWGFTSYKRTHVRTGSTGSLELETSRPWDEDMRCIRLASTKAHQQPITVLDSEGGRVLTGSQDHTLKVFRLEDQLPLYTLHGHCGPITSLFIDKISPMMSGSGSQDGMLCVWDLLTGACMYSIQAHDGSVIALTYSASYVISLGMDEKLCVWERFQGHLLNTIQVSHTYCLSMAMVTHNLLITSKQGSLVVWDVRTGDPVRMVKLGCHDGSVFVKQILVVRDSIVCDYSNQLRIVRFPLVAEKMY